MKKNSKKKGLKLDLKADLYKSLETIIDNNGIVIKFKDPYNKKYNRGNDMIDGKILSQDNWKNIPSKLQNKILKFFKLGEEIANDLQRTI